MKSAYDCVVIGAGPAGGAAAAITAEGGLETLLVEREQVPRFHVGESLMPETYWPLQRLGLTDRVKNAGWQVKKSVQFVTHRGTESAPFFFRQHDQRECSDTWQVERSEFDKMLFDRAAELGADCVDQTRLSDVQFDADGRTTGVVLKCADGQTREIDCKVVIDATGQQSFLANKLGLKEVNPDLKKAAIWGYYRDAVRGEGDNEGATIILQTESKDAWFWFIPQSRGITSIGCVGDNDYLLKGRGTPEQTFQEELDKCPGLKPRLENATRLGSLRTAKEFSYMTKQHAGDGWVLVGDAFGFIDPVYSSGVYFALEMGVRAGDAVVQGFAANDLSAERLGAWSEEFKQGAKWVRKLVHAFYTKEFSIGRFMKEHPEHRSNLTDLLIGRIFHERAGQMFDDMEKSIEKAKMSMAS
ncbi:NAD(P)/FAD-dependent oxidoreductase [Roseiconus nitratireducens]|uniref:NAD(P)/FAD-dependent oxidoreductase n=1 Tax=Roseiconus nitratireducens TaxID=2605748 RepID=A0A5M6DF21_9BACT|nr:NAD(P)/FAD-dependent oxidoreductase [Roseiconus nitratireducens]KAA5543795.1 NAD(P)/FAD-dependent oxidoreductase [Roseiconus nitratireducens]